MDVLKSPVRVVKGLDVQCRKGRRAFIILSLTELSYFLLVP